MSTDSKISRADLMAFGHQCGLANLIDAKRLGAMVTTAQKAADPKEWLQQKRDELAPPELDDSGPEPPADPGKADEANGEGGRERAHSGGRPICGPCSNEAGQDVYRIAGSSQRYVTYYYCPHSRRGFEIRNGIRRRNGQPPLNTPTVFCGESSVGVSRKGKRRAVRPRADEQTGFGARG